jgi:hypothetical protein
MTYNGWANYPTWAVFLWISNEEALWNDALDIVRNSDPTAWDAEQRVGDWIVDELMPHVGGMAGDILTWAIAQVDWGEIYNAIAEALPDVEEDDDEAE